MRSTKIVFGGSLLVSLAVLFSACDKKEEKKAEVAPPIEDQRVVAFRKECGEVSGAWPNFELICDGLAAEKTPEQLAPFLGLVRRLSADLKRLGPEVAKQVVAKCSVTATSKKPSVSELMFCLSFNGLNVEHLATGSDDAKKYAELIEKTREPAPSYPTGSTQDDETLRAQVRQSIVYSCIEQAEAYLKAACSAIAVHEVFAGRPFGDNGELAKAFDTVVGLYSAAGLPQQYAKQALKDIGIPIEVIDAPGNVQAAATKAASDAAEAAKNQHEQSKKDANDFLESNNVPFRL